MRTKKGLTLIELLICITLTSVIIITLFSLYYFSWKQFKLNISRYNLQQQINYALEHIRLYSQTAVEISPCLPGGGTTGTVKRMAYLNFTGQSDVYNITPNDATDDKPYCYKRDSSTGSLIFRDGSCSDPSANEEMLVDGKFHPMISFQYTVGEEPNFFNAVITAEYAKTESPIQKSEGIKLWYTDIIK